MKYLLFQFFLFVFVCIFFYKRKKSHLLFIVIIWLISTLFSLLFCFFFDFDEMTWEAVFFFDFCFFLSIGTIWNLSIDNLYVSQRMQNNILAFMIMLGLIAVTPFIENTIYVIQSYFQGNNSELIDMYNSKMDSNTNQAELVTWLSYPSKLLNSINSRFLYLSCFLFFVILLNPKITLRKILLPSLAILNPVMFGIAKSGRGSAVFTMIFMLYLFVLFRKKISKEVGRSLKRAAIIVVVFLVIVLTIMTIARLDNSPSQSTAIMSVSLYFGEGQVRFFNDMWNIEQHTMGDNSFSFFKVFMGQNTVTDNLERRELWDLGTTGVDPRFFYTYIGDIYSDMGKYSLALFFIIFFLLRHILARRMISLCWMFVVCMFSYVLINGYTIYPFKIYALTLNIFVSLLILFILSNFNFFKINENKSKSNCILPSSVSSHSGK